MVECSKARTRLSTGFFCVAVMIWVVIGYLIYSEKRHHDDQQRLKAEFLQSIEETNTSILMIGSDRRVQLANAAADKLFGKCVVNQNVTTLVADEFNDDFEAVYDRIITSHDDEAPAVHMEGMIKTAIGSRDMHIALRPTALGKDTLIMTLIAAEKAPTISLESNVSRRPRSRVSLAPAPVQEQSDIPVASPRR